MERPRDPDEDETCAYRLAAQQAIDVLRQMRAYSDGQEYVFPPLARQGTPHLHRDALSKARRTMGFQGRHERMASVACSARSPGSAST